MDVNQFLAKQKEIAQQNERKSSKPRSRREQEAGDRRRYQALRRFSEQLQEQRMAAFWAEQQKLIRLGPEKVAKIENRRCGHCNELIIPRFEEVRILGTRRTVIRWPECQCPQKQDYVQRWQREQEFVEQEAQLRLYNHRLDRTGLVGWLRLASFENFRPRDDFENGKKCKAQVVEYTQEFLNGGLNRWLVLYGNFGTGKSHLAASIVKAAIDAGCKNVYFRVWPEYLNRLKATFEKDENHEETQTQIIAELRDGDLVVIDDLDKSQPTEWMRSVLYTALNYRYNEQLPTVITFNYGPKDKAPKAPGRLALEEYLGRAIIDRILEVSTLVEFRGPSYRSEIEW